MSPILLTTPTFIMSPDLPIMPTSLMPSPTALLAPTPSVSDNYSRPQTNHAVLILFISVASVVGLSALFICGWHYIKSRKTEDTEAASDFDNKETKVWEPGEAIRGNTGKASGIDAASADKAFIIGDCDSDTSQLGDDDTKNTELPEKDTPADTETEDTDNPEEFFHSKHFILGGFDTSLTISDGDDHDIASLFSNEDRASIVSYISDSKRLSCTNWAAIKQTVADRTSFVQHSVGKVEHAHLADVSLETQIVVEYAEVVTNSTPGKDILEDESQGGGMASLFAEIDAIGELYSSSESSSTISEISPATELSAKADLIGQFDMEASRAMHAPAVSSSPITPASAHFAHRYSSDFRLSASSLSAPSDSSDDCMPLPIIRPLNIKKKNAVSSTPVPAVRAARAARGPAQLFLFKFPDQASLCQAILEDSLVHPRGCSDTDSQVADEAERPYAEVESINSPILPGTPSTTDGSSSHLPSLTDDSMASTSSTFSYEEREREAIANWSSLLHSSLVSGDVDPFDNFCTRRSIKGKGRAICHDTTPIHRLFSRYPRSDDDPANITTCSFVFDAFMDSVIDEGEFVNRPSPSIEDKQGVATDTLHVVSTGQADHISSASTDRLLPKTVVIDDFGTINLVTTRDNPNTPVTDAPEAASTKQRSLSTTTAPPPDKHSDLSHEDRNKTPVGDSAIGIGTISECTPTIVPVMQVHPSKFERRTPTSTKWNNHDTEGSTISYRQSHSSRTLTRFSAQSTVVVPKSHPSTTPAMSGLSPESDEKRSVPAAMITHNAEQANGAGTPKTPSRVQLPRPKVSRVSSLATKSGSVTAAPNQSTPKPASRARSRTIVAQRGPSGVVEPCQQQDDGRIVSAGGSVLARHSLESNRSRPGLELQGSTRRTGSRLDSVPSAPLPKTSSGNAMGLPAKRSRSRAHDPSSPCSKTPLKTATKTTSGQVSRSASLVSASSSGHSTRSAALAPTALRRNHGVARAGLLPRTTPALSRSASVAAPSTPSPKSASRFSRSPLLPSSSNSPLASRRSKDKEPREPLRTITEDILENSASAFEREKGIRSVMDGQSCRETRSSSTGSATFPSDIGTQHSTTQNTRISDGLRGRSTSRPTSIWH